MLEEKENTSVAEENKNEYAPPLVSAVNPAEENGEALRSDRQPKRAKRKLWWIPVLAVAVLLLAYAGLYLYDMLRPVNGEAVLSGTAKALVQNYRDILLPIAETADGDFRTEVSLNLPKEVGNRERNVSAQYTVFRADGAEQTHLVLTAGWNAIDLEWGCDGKQFWLIRTQNLRGSGTEKQQYAVNLDGCVAELENSRLNPAVTDRSPISQEEYDQLHFYLEEMENTYFPDYADKEVSFDLSLVLEKMKQSGKTEIKTSFPTFQTMKEGLQGFRPIRTVTYSVDADGLADTLVYALELSENTKDETVRTVSDIVFAMVGSAGMTAVTDAVRSSGVSVTFSLCVQGERLRSAHIGCTYEKEKAPQKDEKGVTVKSTEKTQETITADCSFSYSGSRMSHFEIRVEDTGAEQPEQPVLSLVYDSEKTNRSEYRTAVEYQAQEETASAALCYGNGAWNLQVGSSSAEGVYTTGNAAKQQNYAEIRVTSVDLYQPDGTFSMDTGLKLTDRYVPWSNPFSLRIERTEEGVTAPQDAVNLREFSETQEKEIKSLLEAIEETKAGITEKQQSDKFLTVEGYEVLTDETRFTTQRGNALAAMQKTLREKFGYARSMQVAVIHEDPDYYWLLTYDAGSKQIYYAVCVEMTPEIAAVYQSAQIENGYIVLQ